MIRRAKSRQERLFYAHTSIAYTYTQAPVYKSKIIDYKQRLEADKDVIVQELCESRGGCPGLFVLTNLMVFVDVKQYWTMLTHCSQLVPNASTDIRGHLKEKKKRKTSRGRKCSRSIVWEKELSLDQSPQRVCVGEETEGHSRKNKT